MTKEQLEQIKSLAEKCGFRPQPGGYSFYRTIELIKVKQSGHWDWFADGDHGTERKVSGTDAESLIAALEKEAGGRRVSAVEQK
jgi:hypothetical protein